jgi:hypothetical protein
MHWDCQRARVKFAYVTRAQDPSPSDIVTQSPPQVCILKIDSSLLLTHVTIYGSVHETTAVHQMA